ncbi:MAG: PDZ domain-containing protein [Polyangiaceae bacterium]|nr:PDZ domain-containing protein [Polyangiaceae bacterium]
MKFQGVFEGAPAEKAGVRVGDLLRKIEGQPVDGLSLADAIQRLRGEKGSQVRVTIERPPGGEWIDTTITRDEIVR